MILLGRMTKDVEVRRGDSDSIFARFPLAVDRRFKKDGKEQTAEFLEKYGREGVKFIVEGRI